MIVVVFLILLFHVFIVFEDRFKTLTIANKLNMVTALTTEGDKPAMIAKLHKTQRMINHKSRAKRGVRVTQSPAFGIPFKF